uniref:Uncharacterized protein n=1 Tax=Plectus sambesii TaxID=2011161 RepID=A0A914VI08_9BILA
MLRTILDRNLEDRDFVEMATMRLKESHQYLETDFKLHVKEVSRVADHCIRHALSDRKDAAFAAQCQGGGLNDSHQHDLVCDRCEQLKSVLGEIRKHVSKYALPDNEKERVEAKYLAAERAIMEMRRHQLRSVLSSTTRKNIVEELGTEGNADALLTLDWAMKWLPTKARETQKDFFGKKGISWHITHVLRRSQDDNFEQRTLVHITEQSSQDSETVLAILRHVLKELKKSGVNSVILRSDNAGCYHGNKVLATINKISEETNVQIMRYTFSESQAGKSSCDRMASVIKRHLHAYIDQGNDGWALKRPPKRSRFSGKQRDYINAAFDRGTRKKSAKVDSRQLAKQMEEELVAGTSTFRFRPNELLSASQISGHFTRKLERKRNLQPECVDDPEAAECSDIDDQDATSEDDEYENTEDPMFYSVEDEMTELVAAANIIDDTGENSDEPSLIPTAPPTTVRLHNLRHRTRKPF